MGKEMAASWHESDERLRMALSAARMVAWEWDPATDLVSVSENAGEVFGLHAGALIERAEQAFDLVHPEDLDRVRSEIMQAVAEPREFLLQCRVPGPGNEDIVWLEVRGHAVTTDAGTTARLAGIVVDVTERQRTEEALQQERDLLSVTLASIGDAVITTDTGSRVTNMNGVAESLTRWSRKDALGQPLETVFQVVDGACQQL